jgi:CDP-glucose 4,6-dehydratase
MENMVVDLKNFYKGKKVLITGHTGFKGSWLSIWLLNLGAEVAGISLPPDTSKGNFVLAKLESKMDSYYQDIRDFQEVKNIFKKVQPDIVFHLAAQPLVLKSYSNPHETFETNVQGTVNILEAVRTTETVKELVLITTDKVYKNHDWIWGYRENDELGGYDPYSASKAAAELVIDSYIKSFFSPKDFENHGKIVASVRAGNVLGGGDWSENRIIPDFFKAIEAGKSLEIRNPQATRPWQHVLDPLGGYLMLAAKMEGNPGLFSGAWNFGPQMESNLSVLALVERLIKFTKKGEFEITSDPNAQHEANLLKLDISKAEHFLKYRSVLDIEETIELTANWYNNYNQTNVYEFCSNQISFWSQKYHKQHA